jgi:hypothetical protein
MFPCPTLPCNNDLQFIILYYVTHYRALFFNFELSTAEWWLLSVTAQQLTSFTLWHIVLCENRTEYYTSCVNKGVSTAEWGLSSVTA